MERRSEREGRVGRGWGESGQLEGAGERKEMGKSGKRVRREGGAGRGQVGSDPE